MKGFFGGGKGNEVKKEKNRGKKRKQEKKRKNKKIFTPLSTDIVLVVLLTLHEIQYRDELDAVDAREAEGQEDQVQGLLEFDHGAGVVRVDADVFGFDFCNARQRGLFGREGENFGESGEGGGGGGGGDGQEEDEGGGFFHVQVKWISILRVTDL